MNYLKRDITKFLNNNDRKHSTKCPLMPFLNSKTQLLTVTVLTTKTFVFVYLKGGECKLRIQFNSNLIDQMKLI